MVQLKSRCGNFLVKSLTRPFNDWRRSYKHDLDFLGPGEGRPFCMGSHMGENVNIRLA